MSIYRIRTTWTGWSGAPGYTNLYMGAPPIAADLVAIRSFFNSQAAAFPGSIVWQTEGTGDVLDEATGTLTGGWSAATPASASGTGGSSVFSALAGYYVTWNTGTVVDGRRLTARTFMVPAAASVFDTSGGFNTSYRTTAATAAGTLIAAMSVPLVAWHRPVKNKTTGAVIRVGQAKNIGSATVPMKGTVLRSRRD